MLRKVPLTREDGQSFYRIRCRCGAIGDVLNNSPTRGHIPFDALKRRYAAMGWKLGLKESQDRCLACQASKRLAGGAALRIADDTPEYAMLMKYTVNRPPANKDLIDRLNEEDCIHKYRTVADVAADKLIYRIDLEEDEMNDNVTQLHADAPREMRRSDRQIIFNKLQDVYPKEDAGYSDGWDDERVAKDLSVPRAWVTTIREENFGQVIDEEARARKLAETAEKAFRAETELRFRRVVVAAGNARAALDALDGAVEAMRQHLFGDRQPVKGAAAKTKG